jgi:hypothetical protein
MIDQFPEQCGCEDAIPFQWRRNQIRLLSLMSRLRVNGRYYFERSGRSRLGLLPSAKAAMRLSAGAQARAHAKSMCVSFEPEAPKLGRASRASQVARSP